MSRAIQPVGESIRVKMALVNARSLVNKTFILHDFFSSNVLDFLFVTETWLTLGDLSPFSDLVPSNCTFINCPRTTGMGGGLASVFKSSFGCRSVKTDTNPLAKDFTSFIDSFDLVQMVKGPTHSLGHKPDLVLVYGHSICDLEICELSFSDHKPVMFTCSLSGQSSKRHQPVLRSRIFSPTVNEDLSAHFNLYSLDPSFNN